MSSMNVNQWEGILSVFLHLYLSSFSLFLEFFRCSLQYRCFGQQTSSQNLFQFSVVNLLNGVLNLTVNTVEHLCVLCSTVRSLRSAVYRIQDRYRS